MIALKKNIDLDLSINVILSLDYVCEIKWFTLQVLRIYAIMKHVYLNRFIPSFDGCVWSVTCLEIMEICNAISYLNFLIYKIS